MKNIQFQAKWSYDVGMFEQPPPPPPHPQEIFLIKLGKL